MWAPGPVRLVNSVLSTTEWLPWLQTSWGDSGHESFTEHNIKADITLQPHWSTKHWQFCKEVCYVSQVYVKLVPWDILHFQELATQVFSSCWGLYSLPFVWLKRTGTSEKESRVLFGSSTCASSANVARRSRWLPRASDTCVCACVRACVRVRACHYKSILN